MRLVEVEHSFFNRRFRVELDDGATVEAVFYRGDTLCISSQVGCAVACTFCASGARGLSRPLSAQELWGQVASAREQGLSVKRVTISGVGEPLHNHAATKELVLRCRAESIGPSLTTSGGPVARLCEWLFLPHNGLTLSIHAGSEAVRARLVPKGPPLSAIFDCLVREVPRLSRSRRKKLALAFLLLAGENDGNHEVDQFIARVAPLGLAVHLYAHNSVAQSQARGVSRERYEEVYGRMREAGLTVRMSSQARLSANGGCGTLLAFQARGARAGHLAVLNSAG